MPDSDFRAPPECQIWSLRFPSELLEAGGRRLEAERLEAERLEAALLEERFLRIRVRTRRLARLLLRLEQPCRQHCLALCRLGSRGAQLLRPELLALTQRS